MAKAQSPKAQLPKGFTSIEKFNGKFTPNGTQYEFSKPLQLNSISKGVFEGMIYRYPLAPQKLYFTSLLGEYHSDVNGFSFGKEIENEENN